MTSLPDDSEPLPFPMIDESLLDDTNIWLPLNKPYGSSAIYDVTVSQIKWLIDSPIDSFLIFLSNHHTSIELILQELEQSDLTKPLIEEYHSHWLKIRQVINNPNKMIALLSESFMQDIESTSIYRQPYKQKWFNPEYMKIIMFIHALYQKLPN